MYARDIILDDSELPSLIPNGDYLAKTLFYIHKPAEDEWCANIKLFFAVKPKGTSKFLTN